MTNLAPETPSADSLRPSTLLGDVADVIRGVTYKKENARSEPTPGYVPILRATNIGNGLVFEDFVFVPCENVSDRQLLRPGDIVIAASSGSASVVGKAAILTGEWRGSFGAFCFVVRAKSELLLPRFLNWYFQSPMYRNLVSELSAGININNLRISQILELEIPLPSLATQREIVAKLDEQFSRLDAGVTALRRAQANLKRYRASVLKAACEGRLVPTEAELARQEGRTYETGEQLLTRILEERRASWTGKGKYKDPTPPGTANLPELPEGWTWATVDQLSSGIRSGSAVVPNEDVGGTPILKSSAIRQGSIELREVKRVSPSPSNDLFTVRNGDWLFTRLSGSPEYVGLCAIVPPEADGWLFPDRLFRARAIHAGTTFFVNLAFQTQFVRSRIRGYLMSSAGHQRITTNVIGEQCIPLPPLAEQTHISAEVGRLLSIADTIEHTLGTALKRAVSAHHALLNRAFAPRPVEDVEEFDTC